MESPNIPNVSEKTQRSKSQKALFRVFSNLHDDKRVCEAKYSNIFNVSLDYIAHVVVEFPSLFIRAKPGVDQDNPQTAEEPPVTVQEGYGLTCLTLLHLLQILTHPAEATIITKTRGLFPTILFLLRTHDPVTFRRLLAELIFCLGDLTQIHESFFQGVTKDYKPELKRFQIPPSKPTANDDASEAPVEEQIKKQSVILTNPASCECLQANICEVLLNLVPDISRLSLDSGCHGDCHPPDLLWACVGCHVENGEVHVKKVSLSLATSLLKQCDLPRGQVQTYLVSLLIGLVSMLCAGFNDVEGDFEGLEENLGECLVTLVERSQSVSVVGGRRAALQTELMSGLMSAITDHGLHRLRTDALKNDVCVSLSLLIRASPDHPLMHNQVFMDGCGELARTLVEEMEVVGHNVTGIVQCLRELVLLELPSVLPTLPVTDSPTLSDPRANDDGNRPLKRKRKPSISGTQAVDDPEPARVDVRRLSRTLHHIVSKITQLVAHLTKDDTPIETYEGALCGIWLLLETVVHCVAVRPHPPPATAASQQTEVSPAPQLRSQPAENLSPWVGVRCIPDLCDLWGHVLKRLADRAPPAEVGAGDGDAPSGDQGGLVSAVYRPIVRSVGALVSIKEMGCLSSEIYSNVTSLLSLHWMPSEMSWQDLKPTNMQQLVRISGALGDHLGEEVIAEAVSVLSLLPKSSAAKWRIHVIRAAAGSPSPAVRAAAVASFPFLLHHCGPNAHHLVIDVLHDVLEKQETQVLLEMAGILGPLACVVSRKAVLQRRALDTPTKLAYQNLYIQCISCDNLPASEPSEGPRDRPKYVDPNIFQPFLKLLKSTDTNIKMKVIGNLQRLFGHISVRSNNAVSVSMMEACLQLIDDPEHRVRMAFSTTVGCFVGTDQSDAASETDRMLIAALKAAASKAEGDGHVPVIETILITMGQLGRKVTSDLFFIIIVCFLDGICNPFSPLTSSVAKTQMKQLVASKNMTMKDLFVEHGRSISKIVTDYCLEVTRRDKYDPMDLVDEVTEIFEFNSSRACLQHTEQYMLPHLVLKATPHASHLIRTLSKALGDPNHKNPLARTIHFIFSELVISAHGNELVQAFSFLERESEWDLPTLLRYGQHVDSELLLHLSTNYSEVLAGIKIYLTKLMFTQKSHLTDEEAADMLQPKLLGIMVHFDNQLNNLTIPLHEKKQVFDSVISLMRLMGPKHITSVRVRLMTTLRLGMKLSKKDPGFQELCCRAWNSFVRSIDLAALGPMLAQIVAYLQPLLKLFPKQVAPIFNYLIVENRAALKHHFHELYFVPEMAELADVNAVLNNYISEPNSDAGLSRQITRLLKGIQHESHDVRAQALTKLRSLLYTNHEQLHQLIGATETAIPVISQLVTALLTGCRESDKSLRILFGECLGELGAIDPGRLELMSSASKDDLTKFAFSVTEDTFAVDLIATLAKAFLRTQDRRQQDCVAFSIQELIRVYEITPDSTPSTPGGRRWSHFSEEVQEIMNPLTKSKYSLNFTHDWSQLQKPIYRTRKGNTFYNWVMTLTGYLISKVSSPKVKQVFDTCRGVVRSDHNMSLYLLPHVAVQVLLDGSSEDHKELKDEMMAVLKHAESLQHGETDDLRYKSAQTVFTLLDHFTKWKRHRVMVLSHKAETTSRSKAAVASSMENVSEDPAYRAVQSFQDQIQQEVLAAASYNCGAFTRSLMHIELFIKNSHEQLADKVDFLQKLYVALNEPDGVAGVMAIKQTKTTLSEQILAYKSIGQLSDSSVCYDQIIQQEPGELTYRQGLLQCRLELGELQSAMDLANGMIAERPLWRASLNAYRVEAAWKLGQWGKLGQFLKTEGESHSWTVGLGKVLYAVKTRDETAFTKNLRDLRDDVMTPLSAASMEVGSYHRGYEYIVRLHMLNELEQSVRCLVGFPRKAVPSHQGEQLTVDQLKQQWASRLQLTQSAFRTQDPILNLRRTLLSLGREEGHLQLDEQIGQCWLQTAKVARECGLLQTAHSSLVSASAYSLPGFSVEKAKWLWDRSDYDMAQSCLEKALEQHYPRRAEFKPEDTTWAKDDRFQCAQMLLLLSQYCEETASMESNAIVKQYREVQKVHNEWEDGYFYVAKYYDKIMTKLFPTDRPEKKGEFIGHVLQFFGQSLLYGNQYIYESMPRMLSLWLDYGAEVAEGEGKGKNEQVMKGMKSLLSQLNKLMSSYTNRLAPYQFLTAFPQLTSRICHAHADVFSQLRDLIAKLIVSFPQQTMWMMMAVSKSSYQIRMRRCQEIFNSAKLLSPELKKFLQDATKLTDRLLELCNWPCDSSISCLSIRQNFKPLQRLLNDSKFSPILLPLQSLMTVTLPSHTVGSTNHDPFPMNQVHIKDLEDTVEILPSLQRPKKITMRGSNGKLYVMLCKPKDDLRKDARLMEFNTIINKFLRKNFESRRRDLHIRTYTVTPLNEECGLLEWVSNTAGFRNIILKLYQERGIYVSGKELKSMSLPPNAPVQKKLDMYRNKLLPRHPPVFGEWFLKTFPDPTSWYNARLSYARTTAVMSMVGYILGLGDRHGENILFDSTNGDVVHVDFNCLFNKGETFDYPEIVPFRLTNNMVEAMGPTQYEGAYRRACEVTLRVMRTQSDPLMSVLKTFIYDPLVEWSKPAKGRSESGEIKNEKAYIHVHNIESRLKGILKNKTKPRGLPLSVEGHVNHLIKEATDEMNLCQMYIGWAAYI